MSTQEVVLDDRRKFERVRIPDFARVFIASEDQQPVGPVRLLGRGGFMVSTTQKFSVGERRSFALIDEPEGIWRRVVAVVRSVGPEGVGFEFEDLDADAAVEVGVIIGRHYTPPAVSGR